MEILTDIESQFHLLLDLVSARLQASGMDVYTCWLDFKEWT